MRTVIDALLTLPILRERGVGHGFTTRAHGDLSPRARATSEGQSRLRALGGELGFDPTLLVTAEQVHGQTIAVAHLCENCGPGREIPHTDGLITGEPWPLLITVADCFPVILYEPSAPMVALVHCGWRGTVAGILPRALNRLIRETGGKRSEVIAGIGPGICARCYEVGDDVVQSAHQAGLSSHLSSDASNAKPRFDIGGALKSQLIDGGVRSEHIEALARCTFEDTNLFSHRRDHSPERGAAIVALPSS